VQLYIYISNKMQRYIDYFIWKLLYKFRVVLPPIIRSAYNCIYSIWYLSHRYCYLPLSWKSWDWFECACRTDIIDPVCSCLKANFHVCSNIYNQQHATLHSLFYLETALHVSVDTITHHQEHKQLYQQHVVFVTPLLLSATIVDGIRLSLIPSSTTHTHTHTHTQTYTNMDKIIIIYAAKPPNDPRRCILTYFNNCDFSKAQTVRSLMMVFFTPKRVGVSARLR
jgi:hypothetical protein